MTRSLAAVVCFSAALLGAPARSEAGVIPWMYDSIFGYGYSGVGYGGGWGAGYRGGYMTGYAPFYQPYYGTGYGGGACCGTTANYAPWTGYVASNACCSPCGGCNPCGNCNSCGTSCDTGCNNCPGGNCGTGSGSATVPSTPYNTPTGQNPTFADPKEPGKTPPADQFRPADPSRDRDRTGPGSSVPSTGGFGNPGTDSPMVEPNNNAPF
ncbi:MAG TPA: hypothetical protein VM452_15885, partial [Caulifigura sp.]|nr:hypothetical protein [Caulifigura sp.]